MEVISKTGRFTCEVCHAIQTRTYSQSEIVEAVKKYGGNSLYAVQGLLPNGWHDGMCNVCVPRHDGFRKYFEAHPA